MNRRDFLAATIAGAALTPNTQSVTTDNLLRLDISDPTLEALNTDGVVLFGISPDASVLVGRADKTRIVFLDAKTRIAISESAAIPEIGLIDETAVSWSPDGKRIAFGLQAWRLLRDSDIFIADVETGEVINLTPEGHEKEADSLLTVPDVQIDISPVWLDDDTILFARHSGFDEDEITCELWTISLGDRTEQLYMDLTEHNIRDIFTKIWLLSGMELVFTAIINDENHQRAVVMITADGDVTTPHREQMRTAHLLSVNDSHMIIQDVQAFEWWYMPLDASQDPVPLWEQFELPDGWVNTAFPILGPEPDTMFTVLQTPHRKDSAYLFTPDGDRQIAVLTGVYDHQTSHWSKDSILIAGKSDSWLVPLEGVFG